MLLHSDSILRARFYHHLEWREHTIVTRDTYFEAGFCGESMALWELKREGDA